jgi:hypothetical protein
MPIRFFLPALLFIAACDPSTPPDFGPTAALSFVEGTVYYGPLEGSGLDGYRGRGSDDPEIAAATGVTADRHFDIMRALNSDRTLGEKASDVRGILEAPGLHPLSRWMLRQGASVEVLDVMRKSETAAKADDVAYFTNHLLETRNPHADRVAWALTRLEEKWTDAEVRTAATNAATNAREWLREQCGTCAEEGMPPSDARLPLAEAAARLEAVASAR